MQLCTVHDKNPGCAEFCFQSDPDQLQVGDEGLDYVYVGHSSESCYTRGLSHQADMRAGLQGKLETSHMASHIHSVHGGQRDRAKFVMKKVKSYPSSFLRILAECIRIKYRSEEKGIMVMNQKIWGFRTILAAKTVGLQL